MLYRVICEPIYSENVKHKSKMEFFRTKIESIIMHEDEDKPYEVKERINLMRINMQLSKLHKLKA